MDKEQRKIKRMAKGSCERYTQGDRHTCEDLLRPIALCCDACRAKAILAQGRVREPYCKL